MGKRRLFRFSLEYPYGGRCLESRGHLYPKASPWCPRLSLSLGLSLSLREPPPTPSPCPPPSFTVTVALECTQSKLTSLASLAYLLLRAKTGSWSTGEQQPWSRVRRARLCNGKQAQQLAGRSQCFRFHSIWLVHHCGLHDPDVSIERLHPPCGLSTL